MSQATGYDVATAIALTISEAALVIQREEREFTSREVADILLEMSALIMVNAEEFKP